MPIIDRVPGFVRVSGLEIECPRCHTVLGSGDTPEPTSHPSFARRLEAIGWVYVRSDGWHCPPCARVVLGQSLAREVQERCGA